jgi:hypothetical protein
LIPLIGSEKGEIGRAKTYFYLLNFVEKWMSSVGGVFVKYEGPELAYMGSRCNMAQGESLDMSTVVKSTSSLEYSGVSPSDTSSGIGKEAALAFKYLSKSIMS